MTALTDSLAEGAVQAVLKAGELLADPAAEQVILSVICVMILPLSAAPAPENTITPTRLLLAVVP